MQQDKLHASILRKRGWPYQIRLSVSRGTPPDRGAIHSLHKKECKEEVHWKVEDFFSRVSQDLYLVVCRVVRPSSRSSKEQSGD